MPAATGTVGHSPASRLRIDSSGSTATTAAPVGTSSRVSFPVPAARSTTTVPGPSRRCSASHATASAGYPGRARS